MHAPYPDDPHHDPLRGRDAAGAYDAPYHTGAAHGATGRGVGGLLRSVRGRQLLAALAALLLLLVVGLVWWASPENRARRELARANEEIAEKERAVLEARQLLERRIAELRAAKAEADVQATIYEGVLERDGAGERAAPVERRSAAGEVEPRVTGEPVRVQRR